LRAAGAIDQLKNKIFFRIRGMPDRKRLVPLTKLREDARAFLRDQAGHRSAHETNNNLLEALVKDPTLVAYDVM
jgi:predicted metal-dependent hydrolase